MNTWYKGNIVHAIFTTNHNIIRTIFPIQRIRRLHRHHCRGGTTVCIRNREDRVAIKDAAVAILTYSRIFVNRDSAKDVGVRGCDTVQCISVGRSTACGVQGHAAVISTETGHLDCIRRIGREIQFGGQFDVDGG